MMRWVRRGWMWWAVMRVCVRCFLRWGVCPSRWWCLLSGLILGGGLLMRVGGR